MKPVLPTITLALLPLLTAPVAAQNCQDLRAACEAKGSLGEVGQGNCKAYRAQCGGSRQRVDCRALRQACMYKGSLGEVGQGNCKAYRESCR